MKIGAIHGSRITASSEPQNHRAPGRRPERRHRPTTARSALRSTAAPGATDGTRRAGVSPGTPRLWPSWSCPPTTPRVAAYHAARDQFAQPLVRKRAFLLAVATRYHCRSAMYSPLRVARDAGPAAAPGAKPPPTSRLRCYHRPPINTVVIRTIRPDGSKMLTYKGYKTPAEFDAGMPTTSTRPLSPTGRRFSASAAAPSPPQGWSLLMVRTSATRSISSRR